jgi:hypothetical protein
MGIASGMLIPSLFFGGRAGPVDCNSPHPLIGGAAGGLQGAEGRVFVQRSAAFKAGPSRFTSRAKATSVNVAAVPYSCDQYALRRVVDRVDDAVVPDPHPVDVLGAFDPRHPLRPRLSRWIPNLRCDPYLDVARQAA